MKFNVSSLSSSLLDAKVYMNVLLAPLMVPFQKNTFDDGSLSAREMTPNGFMKIGSGIPATDGWHGTKSFEGFGSKAKLAESVAIQETYRQSPEIVDGTGPYKDNFLVEGGHQRQGDHGAQSTNEDRAKDQHNISILAVDGDIKDAWIAFDRNPTKLVDNIVFRPNEALGVMVAEVDGTILVGGTIITNPDGSKVIQMSHNREFFDEFIDNDGNPYNGHQEFDDNHGYFDVAAGIGNISTVAHVTLYPTDDFAII